MGLWFPGNDSNPVLRKGILTITTYEPHSETDLPQDARHCRPSVQLLTVRLLVTAVRTADLAECNDAAGELLLHSIIFVLDKARPTLTLRACALESRTSAGFGNVEYEDPLRRKRTEDLTEQSAQRVKRIILVE